ncbi:hypothetical protein ACIQRH_25185, partial [Pseudomonas sp. NPDC090964]|uniref:hypothetical protein n=1 Tax=Pseudomonas sp. NPDC090964 TaxID=3364482 RepID=UPI00381B0551
ISVPQLGHMLVWHLRREQPENLANPMVCTTASGGYSALMAATESTAKNGKRPVARATSHQPSA